MFIFQRFHLVYFLLSLSMSPLLSHHLANCPGAVQCQLQCSLQCIAVPVECLTSGLGTCRCIAWHRNFVVKFHHVNLRSEEKLQLHRNSELRRAEVHAPIQSRASFDSPVPVMALT